MGDTLVIYPHDICPVDGVVIEGHGVMDESYLTGEPFQITKTSRLDGDLGRDQRRIGADHSHDPARRRFALREDHGGHARVRGQAAAVAAAGRSPGRDLHAGGPDGRPPRLGHQRRSHSLPRGAGHRHALPAAASRSRSPSSARFPCAPAGRSSSRAPSCSSRSPSVGRRSSTRPGRSRMASRS